MINTSNWKFDVLANPATSVIFLGKGFIIRVKEQKIEGKIRFFERKIFGWKVWWVIVVVGIIGVAVTLLGFGIYFEKERAEEEYEAAVMQFFEKQDLCDEKIAELTLKITEVEAVDLVDGRASESEQKLALNEMAERARGEACTREEPEGLTDGLRRQIEIVEGEILGVEKSLAELTDGLKTFGEELYRVFRGELETKIAEAQRSYDGSAGMVAREQTRTELGQKIEEAWGVLGSERNHAVFYRLTEELRVAMEAVDKRIATKQAQVLAAKRHAEELQKKADWESIPAGQRIVNEAKKYLTDVRSAYYGAEWGGYGVPTNGNYAVAWRQYVGVPQMDDCGKFVATAVRASGVDWAFPTGNKLWTKTIAEHLASSGYWTRVENTGNLASLQVGDVFVYHGGADAANHTFIYIGGGQGAHARWGLAMPYAFDMMKPYAKPGSWPEEMTDADWMAASYEDLVSSDGQYFGGHWGTRTGAYEIWRAHY